LPVASDAAARLPALLRPLSDEPGRSALFLDFDGTLSAVVVDPVGARPLPDVPALLAALAVPFALVAVISGRPTAFLADVLGEPKGVTLVGLYGLERALRGPVHDTWAAVIDEVVAEALATAPEGVYVEPKGLTVTLHFRRAPEHKDWVVAFAERQHETRGLMVHPGRLERELRPALDVDKGTVVRGLVQEYDEQHGAAPLRALAAFGDDVGDLPAFAALAALAAPAAPAAPGAEAAAPSRTVVRVAAVDTESPPAVAAAADLTVPGATGAVALLQDLAAAAAAAAAAGPTA
jgi:trehalose 6-phosphate phosphatase